VLVPRQLDQPEQLRVLQQRAVSGHRSQSGRQEAGHRAAEGKSP